MKRIEREKLRRDSLTDSIVNKSIYIQGHGSIKYNQITSEMIIEKREKILAWREKKANPQPKQKTVKYCKICGDETPNSREVYCSDKCRKEKARRDSFQRDKSKKVLTDHICNECGNVFMPEYGNKRRGFCSDECGSRHANRNRKHIRRERFNVAFRQCVYKAQIYRRDGFRCQICNGKVNMKAQVPHPLAPTIDHIIALANGGTHEPSNVRLAHFICNSIKGDRTTDGGDQLLLFG